MSDQKEKKCFICQEKLNLLGPSRDYKYFICAKCRTIQLSPMPTPEELEDLYAKSYLKENQVESSMSPEYWQKVSSNYNQSILKIIQIHKVKGSILDFGAGYGFLCKLLTNKGYDCIGVELSEQKLAYCKENKMPVSKAGVEVFEQKKEQLSAITMCAVFEHLSGHVDFLKQMGKGLKKDGVIISLHPTAMIYFLLSYILRLGDTNAELPSLAGAFAPPWHTTFVSMKGMKNIAEQAGFVITGVYPAPQGRLDGVLGIIQIILEKVNILGWSLFRSYWPLVTSHIFVLRKVE